MFFPSFTCCTASILNSVVYSCLGIFSIASFFLVEFTHDLMEDEISGEPHRPASGGSRLAAISRKPAPPHRPPNTVRDSNE
jgi:hypothetical protein